MGADARHVISAVISSIVISAFRDRVVQRLPAESGELLRNPVGGGPEVREVQRALMLADRAARDWLGGALAELRHGVPNRLEELPLSWVGRGAGMRSCSLRERRSVRRR